MKAFLLVCVITVTSASDTGSQLDYHRQEEWPGVCQTGQKQSPVNVVGPFVTVNVDEGMMNLPSAASEVTMRNLHNKNTIKFEPEAPLTVDVPGLEGEVAKVVQLHFHWGSDSKGSEHQFLGKQFAAEAHLVTSYGENKYAVFARFFRLGRENEALEALLEAQENSEEEVEEFNLLELYPNNQHILYTYEGSLTTPGCDEVVHWVINAHPLTISKNQLRRLRSVRLGDGTTHPLSFNWRHLKSLNGRQVTKLMYHRRK